MTISREADIKLWSLLFREKENKAVWKHESSETSNARDLNAN